MAFHAFNFAEDQPSMEEIIEAMQLDMEQAQIKTGELLSHWVLSWNGGRPSEAEIVDAARELLHDLGYTDSHKFTVAIHDDTEYLHAHVVACKVDAWTGRILREGKGWWKNEAQRSLARIAHRHGWTLEPGAKFRVAPTPRQVPVEGQPYLASYASHRKPDPLLASSFQRDPKVWNMELGGDYRLVPYHPGMKVMGPELIETPAGAPKPKLSKAAQRLEKHSGLKSGQRQLQEALYAFLADHRKDLRAWKFGHFHAALAQYGLSCEKVQHGGKVGVVFSLDGVFKASASKVCPELTLPKLLKTLSAQSWRDARPEVLEKLSQVRGSSQIAQEPTAKERENTRFTRDELESLRRIPPRRVFMMLKANLINYAVLRSVKHINIENYKSMKALLALASHLDWERERDQKLRAEDVVGSGENSAELLGELFAQAFSDMSRSIGAGILRLIAKIKGDDALVEGVCDELFDAICQERMQKGNPIRDSIDLCRIAGMRFSAAAPFLAKSFPDELTKTREVPVQEMIAAAREQRVKIAREHESVARQVAELMTALQAEKLDVAVRMPYALQRRLGIFPVNLKSASFSQISAALPDIAIQSEAGSTEGPVAVEFRPVLPENKFGFAVKVKEGSEFLKKFPPTALFSTAGVEACAYYVICKEYAPEFQAHLLNKIAEEFKIHVNPEPSVQLGLKSESKLLSWTRKRPIELEEYALGLFDAWTRERMKTAKPNASHPRVQAARSFPSEPRLKRPAAPEDLALKEQARLRNLYGEKLDPARSDWMVAGLLYAKGATFSEVYSWLIQHSEQRGLFSPKQFDRQCHRVAQRRAPVQVLGAESSWRNQAEKRQSASPLTKEARECCQEWREELVAAPGKIVPTREALAAQATNITPEQESLT